MCPVKYAGECRTISQAAERADSLAPGTITSGDLGLSMLFSLPPLYSVSSSPLFFFFFFFLSYSEGAAQLGPGNKKTLDDRYSVPMVARMYALTCLCFSCTCAPYGGFNLYLCVCVRVYVSICGCAEHVEAQIPAEGLRSDWNSVMISVC